MSTSNARDWLDQRTYRRKIRDQSRDLHPRQFRLRLQVRRQVHLHGWPLLPDPLPKSTQLLASTGSGERLRLHVDGLTAPRGLLAPHEVDEVLPELSPTASEQEQIEHKRRSNTLAARKSRKRKLEHQQGLEAQVEDLKCEVTRWRERALMAQEMLRAAGIKFDVEAMGM